MYVIYKSTMFAQIQEYISQVPKHILIGVALVVVGLVGFFLWKKFGGKGKDSENEVVKGEEQAALFAQSVQQGLEREEEPMMSAMTPGYAKEIQTGLEDLEDAAAAAPVVAAIADDDSDSDLGDYE
ncbi:hypothetical protein ATCVNEJV3_755R [Acanthocystis turfacea Chlorella virus NE-JV-3]|nr:hypothetical protein ATCVNEJV3_755R [Acanthocystis turfacea Chlorella virus NE-JV-3]